MAFFDVFRSEASRRAAFAKEVMATLQSSGAPGPIEFEPEAFRVRTATMLFNLENTWQLYKGLPKAGQARVLQQYSAPRGGPPTTAAELMACLRPMVRDRDYLEHARIQMRRMMQENPFEVAMPHLLLGEHHVVTLVANLEATLITITWAHLAEAGVSAEQAFAAAGANLRALPAGLRELRPGLWASTQGDDFDASRMLRRTAHELPVRGAPVALAAHRNALFITGDRDEENLEALARLAEEALKAPRAMAPLLLRYDGDNWQNWMPPRAWKVRSTFEGWELDAQLARYNGLKRALEELEDELGEEAHPFGGYFYASLVGLHDENGRIATGAIWQPTPTLLPRCDRLFLKRSPEEDLEVAWDDAARVLGDHLEKVKGYPERWKIEAFPEGDLYAALEKVGTTLG